MSFTFQSETLFIDSASDMAEKIKKIDAIITALLDLSLTAVGKQDIVEYTLGDGQTKIRTQFRGMSAILRAIDDYEKLRQRYFNRLNGHTFRLVDSKSVLIGFGRNHR